MEREPKPLQSSVSSLQDGGTLVSPMGPETERCREFLHRNRMNRYLVYISICAWVALMDVRVFAQTSSETQTFGSIHEKTSPEVTEWVQSQIDIARKGDISLPDATSNVREAQSTPESKLPKAILVESVFVRTAVLSAFQQLGDRTLKGQHAELRKVLKQWLLEMPNEETLLEAVGITGNRSVAEFYRANQDRYFESMMQAEWTSLALASKPNSLGLLAHVNMTRVLTELYCFCTTPSILSGPATEANFLSALNESDERIYVLDSGRFQRLSAFRETLKSILTKSGLAYEGLTR